MTDSSYSYLLSIYIWKSQEYFHFCRVGLFTSSEFQPHLHKVKKNVDLQDFTSVCSQPVRSPDDSGVLSPRATALESVSKGRSFHLCSDVYTCDLSSCAFVFEQSLPEELVSQWPWWCFYFVPSTAGSRGGHGLSYASQGGYTSTLRSSERSRGGCT